MMCFLVSYYQLFLSIYILSVMLYQIYVNNRRIAYGSTVTEALEMLSKYSGVFQIGSTATVNLDYLLMGGGSVQNRLPFEAKTFDELQTFLRKFPETAKETFEKRSWEDVAIIKQIEAIKLKEESNEQLQQKSTLNYIPIIVAGLIGLGVGIGIGITIER